MSDSPELRFLRGYKDAIMYFNMLDRNLAYNLRWVSSANGRERTLETFLAYAFDKKVKLTTTLIRSKGLEAIYTGFLVLAEQCRTARNGLVHGHWEFVPRAEQPIRYHVVAPIAEQGAFDQRSFERFVTTFAEANTLFIKLSKMHPLV